MSSLHKFKMFNLIFFGAVSIVLFQNCSMVGNPKDYPEVNGSSSTAASSQTVVAGTPALKILESRCNTCHGATAGPGNIFGLTDVQHLVSAGLVVSGQPDQSLIIQAIQAGRMPPGGGMPTSEIDVLRQWITDGMPVSTGTTIGGTNPTPTTLPPLPVGTSLEAQAITILQNQCYACHGTVASGGIDRINDPAYLISKGYIVPGNPAGSIIYDAISAGRMPLGSAKLSMTDSNIIRDWILAGAKAPSTAPPPPEVIPLSASYKSINANILMPKCVGCHSATNAKSGVKLDSYTAVLRYVVAGNPSSSTLYDITKSGEMPPSPNIDLTAAELTVLSDWIKAGALNN